MPNIKETDLGPPIIEFMQAQGYEMFQEVRLGGMGMPIVDLVARKGKELHAIELKTTMGLAVMQQGDYNKKYFHYSSIAVPAPRGKYGDDKRPRQFAQHICREFGIGVYYIDASLRDIYPGIEAANRIRVEEIIPALHTESGADMAENYTLDWITDDHHVNSEEFPKAGSKGGGYVTPYKTMIKVVKSFITDHPGCLITEIESHLIEQARLGNISYVPKRFTLMSNLRDIEKWCIVRKRKSFNSYYVM